MPMPARWRSATTRPTERRKYDSWMRWRRSPVWIAFCTSFHASFNTSGQGSPNRMSISLSTRRRLLLHFSSVMICQQNGHAAIQRRRGCRIAAFCDHTCTFRWWLSSSPWFSCAKQGTESTLPMLANRRSSPDKRGSLPSYDNRIRR